MRRFEYSDGGSDKFWEVDRAGAAVTVRFGRIGTNGQTQVKDRGTEEAAAAYLAQLVGQKVRKGYVEVDVPAAPDTAVSTSGAAPVDPPADVAADADAPAEAGVPDAAPSPGGPVGPGPRSDETSFEIPRAWWTAAHPTRGLGPNRPPTVDADEVAARVAGLARRHGADVRKVLAHPDSEPALVAAAERCLDPEPGLWRSGDDPDPLGVATVLVILTLGLNWQDRGEGYGLIDDLVARHGLVFTAEVGALLAVPAANTAYGRAWQLHNDLHVATAPADQFDLDGVIDLLARVRAHLAGADDETYAEAVERLDALRARSAGVRLATSFLLPTEAAWVARDATERVHQVHYRTPGLLLAAVATPDQALAVLDRYQFARALLGATPPVLYALVTRLGPSALPALLRPLGDQIEVAARKRLLSTIATFPTDEALEALLDRLDQKYVGPAVVEALGRFPQRAMRLLAQRATGTDPRARSARDLLRSHVAAHRDLVDDVRATLSPAASAVLEELADRAAAVAVAGDDRVPEVLRDPPWQSRRKAAKPVVVAGLEPPAGDGLVWEPGEREAWATVRMHDWHARNITDWSTAVDNAFRPGTYGSVQLLALAPPELVRGRLAGWTSASYAWDALPALQRLLANFGDEAVPVVVQLVGNEASFAPALLPVESAPVAALMAGWLVRAKTRAPLARTWLRRHPEAAAGALIPAALGKPGKDRTAAETALRLIAADHPDLVRAAAAAHGPEAEAAVEATLAVDPLDVLPARIPPLPSWLDPAHLPPLLLAARDAALPTAAVANLCTMLAISKPGEPYAGVALVRPVLDPASAAEMAWSLFERWQAAGFPPKEGWILDALGLLGDDETVRRLSPLIRAWPGEGAHKRAVTALDVLAAIGTDVALMHLHHIAEKAKFRGLKTNARAKMDEVADALGLTAEQLADRLVPDFGLEPDGSMVLDYGPRRFRVGFDEQLKPVVADEDGTRRKALPRPNANDDPELAPVAYAAFSALKKDVRTVATDQIRRFERAMVAGRRWSGAEQRAFFVDHPLLWHLARRLVWATFDDGGAVTGSFRVAEDRTFADHHDAELTVADDAVVGIAHPLHLADTLPAWGDLFADYEILQPFPQLGRDVWALEPGEEQATRFTRYEGLVVETTRILGLSSRGWERGTPQDGGIQLTVYRQVADGCFVVLDLEPGIIAGMATEWKEQTLRTIWVTDGPTDWGGAGHHPLGTLGAVGASELIRDLEHLRG